MRLRLLVVLVAASSIGGPFAVQGCSSSSDVAGAADAGASEVGPSDARVPDVASEEAGCDPNGNLFAKVHDASIGDGASTTGVCLGCAKAKCDDAVGKCTADCPCQAIVGRSLECYLTTQQIGCAYDLTNYLVPAETRKDALALLGCVSNECPAECVIDGGTAAPDASDAATD